MKKNLFKSLFAFMFIFMSGIVLTACGTKDFDASKIKVGNSTFTYDGYNHVCEIDYEVENVEVSVTYSTTKDGEFKPATELTFIGVGTYNVYYKISAEGYNDFVSEEAVEFTVNPKAINVSVSSIETLVGTQPVLDDLTYSTTDAVNGDDLQVSFSVGNKVGDATKAYDVATATVGEEYEIVATSANGNYNITFADATIVVVDNIKVSGQSGTRYFSDLESAYEAVQENDTIKLYNDITSGTSEYYGDITLLASSKNYKFTLDLNGHVIEAELDFVNLNTTSPVTYTNYGIDVTIIDSSEYKTGCIGCTLNDYGVLVKGNDKVKVTMNGIALKGIDGGLYSNGMCAGATIIATDCTFEGDSVGAYLAGKYTYTFTDCTFEGKTAYYTKSGSHAITNTHFIGNATTYVEPTHFGNGCVETGSALAVDSAQGYLQPMSVVVNNCTFDSLAGYGIEVFSTTTPSGQEESYATIIVNDANYSTYATDKPVYTEYSGVITGVADTQLEKGYEA